MFDEGTGAEWVCHRHADIRLPLREVIAHTPSGLPYLRPEIQLLWKAKDTRPKDDADFALVFPLLTREAGSGSRKCSAGTTPNTPGSGRATERD